MKKTFSPHDKARVALEAIRGIKPMGQIVSAFGVHPTQVGVWRKHVLANLPTLFSRPLKSRTDDRDQLIDRLYRLVGQRDTELEWLKKSLRQFDP